KRQIAMPFTRFCFLLAVAALCACELGCKKSKPSEQATPAADQSAPSTETPAPAPAAAEVKPPPPLRAKADVLAALQRKDYSGAVAAITQVKLGMTSDQRPEYNELLARVRGELAVAARIDPSAQGAFNALRQIEAGR